jgi:hypothetical protein
LLAEGVFQREHDRGEGQQQQHEDHRLPMTLCEVQQLSRYLSNVNW